LYFGYSGTVLNIHAATAVLIDQGGAGGLVWVSMHPPNPCNKSDSHDLETGDFDDLFRPGTAVHAVWRAELRRVARGLAELKAAGVIVLWRPFHEMNGGWFWWGSHHEGKWLPPEQFRRLWQVTHQILTQEDDLDHLLWVYAPNVNDGGTRQPADHYYPGAAWVDLTALDWYTDAPRWDDIRSSYGELARLGKPIGISEFGPAEGPFDNRQFLDFLNESPQPWAFFSYWHSWEGADVAIVDHPHAAELLLHPQVVNRGVQSSESAQPKP
ncbi:MAG: glycosyl hydrolase, partial [Planctomycetota bacterium]